MYIYLSSMMNNDIDLSINFDNVHEQCACVGNGKQ